MVLGLYSLLLLHLIWLNVILDVDVGWFCKTTITFFFFFIKSLCQLLSEKDFKNNFLTRSWQLAIEFHMRTPCPAKVGRARMKGFLISFSCWCKTGRALKMSDIDKKWITVCLRRYCQSNLINWAVRIRLTKYPSIYFNCKCEGDLKVFGFSRSSLLSLLRTPKHLFANVMQSDPMWTYFKEILDWHFNRLLKGS